jgi:hypothetical protein
MSDDKPSYKTGYGRPPLESRFKPGQSGNPKGRPKKRLDYDDIFRHELLRKVGITENGSIKRVPKIKALVRATINGALQGKVPQQRAVLNWINRKGFALEPVREMVIRSFLVYPDGTEYEKGADGQYKQIASSTDEKKDA